MYFCTRKLKLKKMANIKKLKDINYVLGDIIEAVYLFEISTGKTNKKLMI
jgi:hypothetical protein